MAKQKETVMDSLQLWAWAFVLIAVALVVNGFILSCLWAWFISSVFELRAITVSEAIGLALVVSCFQSKRLRDEESLADVVRQAAWVLVCNSISTITIAYIVHQFTKG